MITRIRAANFRSLGDPVDVALDRFVALVGINGSGKSNLIEVPRFVAHALRDGLDAAITSRGGMRGLGRWSAGRPYDVKITIDVGRPDASSGEFSIVLRRDDGADGYRVLSEEAIWSPNVLESHSYRVQEGRWSGPAGLAPRVDPARLALPLIAADERFAPLYEELCSVAVYSIFPDVLRQPQEFDGATPMREHGENWATILRELLKKRPLRDELIAGLATAVDDISDLRVEAIGGFLSPQFQHTYGRGDPGQKQTWFDASQESDGTLRIAGILTALLQRPSPGLLGIEEPELTVHPGALPILHDYLREAASHTQAVITTHSPELLDLIEPSAIRVVRRRDGVTTVAQMDPGQQRLVRDALTSPGELLRVEGIHAA